MGRREPTLEGGTCQDRVGELGAEVARGDLHEAAETSHLKYCLDRTWTVSCRFINASNKVSAMYSGFVLFCNNMSQEQCLREKKYACADKKSVPTSKIKVGAILFLYNVDDKSLLGPFTALSEGGETVDSGAWAMKIDEHSASENVKLEWEDLHRLENASAELPFLESPKKCALTTTQTERALDLLKQAPSYNTEKAGNLLR